MKNGSSVQTWTISEASSKSHKQKPSQQQTTTTVNSTEIINNERTLSLRNIYTFCSLYKT